MTYKKDSPQLERKSIVSRRGKSLRLKTPGWKGFVRMDTLGQGCDEPELKTVLSGTKAHTPKKKPSRAKAEKPVNWIRFFGGLSH